MKYIKLVKNKDDFKKSPNVVLAIDLNNNVYYSDCDTPLKNNSPKEEPKTEIDSTSESMIEQIDLFETFKEISNKIKGSIQNNEIWYLTNDENPIDYEGDDILYNDTDDEFGKLGFDDRLINIEQAFLEGCENIQCIWFPEGLKNIGASCLGFSSIEYVYFPSTLYSIGWLSFAESKLKCIIYNGTKRKWNNILSRSECSMRTNIKVLCNDGLIEY